MANPVGTGNTPLAQNQPREGHAQNQPREGHLGPRLVTDGFDHETRWKISALGLQNFPNRHELTRHLKLSVKELAASARARTLYTEEMLPSQRLSLLRLVANQPPAFVMIVKPLFQILPLDRAFNLCETFFRIAQPLIEGLPEDTALSLCQQMAPCRDKWGLFHIALFGVKDPSDIATLVPLILSAPENAEQLILQHSDTIPEKCHLLDWIIRHPEYHSTLAHCHPLIESAPGLEARKERVTLQSTLFPNDRPYFAQIFSQRAVSPLMHIFASQPRERWEWALRYADEVGRGDVFFNAARFLVTLDLYDMHRLMTTFRCLVPNDFSDEERYACLNMVNRYTPPSHTAAAFLVGEGSYGDKLLFISLFTRLTVEERQALVPLLNSLVSVNTNVKAVITILRCFQAHWSQKFTIRQFLGAVQKNSPLVSKTIRPGESVIAQVADLLRSTPAMSLDISYPDQLDTNCRVTILQEAAAGMRDHFSPILEESSAGLILPSSRPLKADQLVLANTLGNLLFLLLAAGVELPIDFLLAPEFFQRIAHLPESTMERDFEQPRPTLACHVARHFSQFGAIRLSPDFDTWAIQNF